MPKSSDDHGMTGNGNGLTDEKNSDAALRRCSLGWSATGAVSTQGDE